MRGRADDAGPDDPVVMPSRLVDAILARLEEAGAPASLNDQVVRLVEAWEAGQELCEHGVHEGDWCPACNREYKRAAAEWEAS